MTQPTRRTHRWGAGAAGMLVLISACGSTAGSATPAATTVVGTTLAATTVAGNSALIDAVVRRTVGELVAGGATVDEACVRALAAQLPAADLAALAEASRSSDPQATDPQLSEAATALGNRLIECATPPTGAGAATTSAAADSTAPTAAAEALDPCRLLDAQHLAALYPGLGTGTAMDSAGPWGDGRLCTWESSSGQRVRVIVTDGIDVAAWAAEATDHDGLSDGEAVTGLGDRAFVGRGSIGFVHGRRLVQVECFPTFDITAELLVKTATAVDGAL